MAEHVCQRCGEPFPSRSGRNCYCVPCGPVAQQARRAAYRKEHSIERRLYKAKRRLTLRKPDQLSRCWCGNHFVSRRSGRKYCTPLCGQRARRVGQKVVVAPAPALPPVDYNLLLTEIMATARRARGRIDAEAELAGMRIQQKQERLGRVLECLHNPFAVP